MAVKLNSQQEQTVQAVLKAGDDKGATPMEKLAAVLTIGAEANYGNPDHGDRDSLGAFQQRASWGSSTSRLDPYASAERFYDRAKQLRQTKQYGNAGDLAADIQQPAAQYRGRYNAQRPIASAILKQLGVDVHAGTSLASDLSDGTGNDAQSFDPTRGQVSSLEITRPVAPQGTAPPPPAAAALAQPVMPQQYPGAPQSGSPAELMPQPDTTQQQLPDNSTSFGGTEAATAGTSTDSSAPASTGTASVKIASGANASGRPLSHEILGVLDKISAGSGEPITVTTGTNHNKFVVDTTRVSDHYAGNAADIAATGTALTDGATNALLVVARGKTVQWLRNDGGVVNVRLTAANTRKLVESGGIFNVPAANGKRIQVIANTHMGGDHTNHYHVGIS